MTPQRLEGWLKQILFLVVYACTVNSFYMYCLDTRQPLLLIAARHPSSNVHSTQHHTSDVRACKQGAMDCHDMSYKSCGTTAEQPDWKLSNVTSNRGP